MTTLTTANGYEFIVDDEDVDLISEHKWFARKHGKSLYLEGWEWNNELNRNFTLYGHRVILGVTDPTVHIDHTNGNPLDNRKQNLRIVTRSQNIANSRVRDDNTSGYKGVSWHKGKAKWVARVSKDNVRHSLGYFTNPEDAAGAYNRAALRFHGEYARLNTVQG